MNHKMNPFIKYKLSDPLGEEAIMASKTEAFFQRNLGKYFAVIFLTTVVGSFYGYLDHHDFKMGDWLINYQGGFVRRGFIGELIIRISSATRVNPGIYVFALQVSLYSVFLFFSYSLLRRQRLLLPYSLLIISPFIFTFQVSDLTGGYRKEILYLALLAFYVWLANAREAKQFENISVLIFLAYPIIILSHEAMAVYLPYLVIVYWSVVPPNLKNPLRLCLLLLPSVLSFAVTIFSSATEMQILMIQASIAEANYAIEGGAALWLSKDISTGISAVQGQIAHYFFYLVSVALAFIAFLPLLEKLRNLLANKLFLIMLAISFLGSIAVLMVAIDWGRIIYIHLVSLFLILLMPFQGNDSRFLWFSELTSKRKLIAFFVLYALFWRIPHASTDATVAEKSFRRPVFVGYVLPYIKVTRHFACMSADSRKGTGYCK